MDFENADICFKMNEKKRQSGRWQLLSQKTARTFCHLLKCKQQQKLEQKVGIDIYRVVEPNGRRSELLLDVYGRTLQ